MCGTHCSCDNCLAFSRLETVRITGIQKIKCGSPRALGRIQGIDQEEILCPGMREARPQGSLGLLREEGVPSVSQGGAGHAACLHHVQSLGSCHCARGRDPALGCSLAVGRRSGSPCCSGESSSVLFPVFVGTHVLYSVRPVST